MSSNPTSTESFSSWFNRQGFRNFKANELEWYFSKVRNGIQNSQPPRSIWPNIVPTLRILDDLRDHFGKPLELSSTYRSPSYNKAIDGASKSQHVEFKAVDFTVSGVSPSKVFSTLKSWQSSGKIKGGIGKYNTFTHFDTRSYNATW